MKQYFYLIGFLILVNEILCQNKAILISNINEALDQGDLVKAEQLLKATSKDIEIYKKIDEFADLVLEKTQLDAAEKKPVLAVMLEDLRLLQQALTLTRLEEQRAQPIRQAIDAILGALVVSFQDPNLGYTIETIQKSITRLKESRDELQGWDSQAYNLFVTRINELEGILQKALQIESFMPMKPLTQAEIQAREAAGYVAKPQSPYVREGTVPPALPSRVFEVPVTMEQLSARLMQLQQQVRMLRATLQVM